MTPFFWSLPYAAHRTPHTAHRTPHTAHRTPLTTLALMLGLIGIGFVANVAQAQPSWYTPPDSAGEVTEKGLNRQALGSRAPVVVVQGGAASAYIMGAVNCTEDTVGRIAIENGEYHACSGDGTSEILPGGGGNMWAPAFDELAKQIPQMAAIAGGQELKKASANFNSGINHGSTSAGSAYCNERSNHSSAAEKTIRGMGWAPSGIVRTRILLTSFNHVSDQANVYTRNGVPTCSVPSGMSSARACATSHNGFTDNYGSNRGIYTQCSIEITYIEQ